jgi:hypothetical protein
MAISDKTFVGGMPLSLSKRSATQYDVVTVAQNTTQELRDAGEFYPNPEFWTEVSKGNDDFIVARGNTGGAGWIEISKSPFTVDDETLLRIASPVQMPARISLLTSMTHRNSGQQIASFEMISDDEMAGLEPVAAPIAIEILDASQTTTVITINFASAPVQPLRVGQVVSVYGFVDTRLNVNSATVASVVSPTQITLVGNDYAFTSTTITTTLGGGTAFIERYDLIGRARNGIAMVQGNATATNRRYYARSQGGLMRPSGTLAGSHNATSGTDVATAAATGYDTIAWLPPLETVIDVSRKGVFFADRGVDANAALTPRHRFTQVIPNTVRTYWMQFRVRAVPSMSRPIARIVSVAKTGTTTATVITAEPHGLITGQYVGGYGVRDQTNFANLTTGATCTVVDANTFTVIWGSAVTATSYGGYIFRQQGQQPVGGAIAQVAQTVARTNNIVTLVGNATWAAPAVIGNIVELYGVRDAVTGADLGVDGSYEVINLATTTLTLRPAVDGNGVVQAPVGTDIVTTNCGGGVVQRLGYRIHSAQAVEFEPLMTEQASAGNPDAGESSGQQNVAIVGTPAVTVSSGTVTTVSALTGGGVAEDAAAGANPVVTGGVVRTAITPVTLVAGDAVRDTHAGSGAKVIKPYAVPEAGWNASLALTTATAVPIAAAAGASLKRHITAAQIINTGASAVDIIILDGATERWRLPLPVNVPVPLEFPTELITTANTALNANLSAVGTVRFNAQGYTSS